MMAASARLLQMSMLASAVAAFGVGPMAENPMRTLRGGAGESREVGVERSQAMSATVATRS